MFPTLTLGPLVLPTAALTMLLGIWLALTAVERAAKRLHLDPPPVYNLATLAVVAGLVGARLTFVALHWSAFQNNLLGIVWPLNSGYNWAGGLLTGGGAAFFYGRHKQLPLWSTLDALTPGVLVLLMTLSAADLLGGPGLGKPTTMPFGTTTFGTRRHPVQVYELIAGASALAVWWRVSAEPRFSGRPFLTATAAYALGRLLADALRANGPVLSGTGVAGVHVVQLLCLAVLLLCLVVLARQSLALATPAPPENSA